jgi:predicted AlkP superfamily pyrophosphatase or phosphodiesterase
MRADPVHIFVLIDALGWEYAERTHFLADLLPHRAPLRTVLGFSSGAIPSILTGLMPAQHGQWNLFYYDPLTSPFRWLRRFGWLPDRILEHRVTRKLIKEAARRFLGLGPTFQCCISPKLLPFFNWAETRNIYAHHGIPGAETIFDKLETTQVPHRIYSYHDGSDSQLLMRARHDARNSGARFQFLYLCELDAFLHHHCQEPAAIEERLAWYDRELRDLFATARKANPESSLCVFSDHGMTPVEAHIDLAAEVDSLGFRQPEDYLAVYDATMARFWFFSERARASVCGRLENVFCGRLLPEDERRQLGVLFPDRRYGEAIFLLDPGWLIASSGFHAKGYLPKGMHGYHPDDAHSDAVFLSDRAPRATVSAICDVYACMEAAAASVRA